MIKEFIESLKLKDIVFFVLIIVLFCMYFKKNKKVNTLTKRLDKENFGSTSEISQENLIAINNLGEMVKTISDSSGKLTLNELVIQDGDKNVNVLDKLKFIEADVKSNRTDFDNRVKHVDGKKYVTVNDLAKVLQGERNYISGEIQRMVKMISK